MRMTMHNTMHNRLMSSLTHGLERSLEENSVAHILMAHDLRYSTVSSSMLLSSMVPHDGA